MPKSRSEVFRRLLPQIIASSSRGCLELTTGLAIGLPTIIIPYVTNDQDVIKLTYEEASWFASIRPVAMILATLFSGYLSSSLGRKLTMLIAIVPHMIGTSFLYLANNATMILIGISLMGFASGICDLVVTTYVGEICEPSIRGTILIVSNFMFQFGVLLTYFLGSLLPWRTVSLLVMIAPLAGGIIILISPEVPSWLLLKNRRDDAKRSLQWLRGRVPFQLVEEEFKQIETHVNFTTKCDSCFRDNNNYQECEHLHHNFVNRIKELFERQNVAAIVIIIILFLLIMLKGSYAMQPFDFQILVAYGVRIDAKWGIVAIGVAGLLGRFLAIPAIKYFGKRNSTLFSLIFIVISLISLGIYAVVKLPYMWTSFQMDENIQIENSNIPLVLFLMYYFFSGLTVDCLPWILTAEIFPLRNRAGCTCIAMVISQVFQFLTTKSYIYLETGAGLSGTILFFSLVSFIGLIYVYFCLPETEGVSIHEIEEFFLDKNRKCTDVNIKKFIQNKRNHIS